EKAGRRTRDRLFGTFVLSEEVNVLVDLARSEQFVDSARLRELGLNLQQAVGDRHRGAAAGARGKRVDLTHGVVDHERNALNALLLRRWQRGDEVREHVLGPTAQHVEVALVQKIRLTGDAYGRLRRAGRRSRAGCRSGRDPGSRWRRSGCSR